MGRSLRRLPPLPAFNTIGHQEKINLMRALLQPLSGYLGGRDTTGKWCRELAAEWSDTFGVRHSIPCNSATMGLYAACRAAGVGPGDLVYTTPFSMSATAACALLLGAEIKFIDIEPTRYAIDIEKIPTRHRKPKAMIVANIFGHPAYLFRLRAWADANHVVLIEDNAQSPLAMEQGQYAGTIGHMGVFSLNVHKHIQAGEGGVVVTNDTSFAEMVEDVVNHGELRGGRAGLNLRMTEPTAAIAIAQLRKAPAIIKGRRKLAHNLTEIFSLLPGVHPSREDKGCTHVYYLWTARVDGDAQRLVERLRKHGVPVNYKYSPNLCSIFDPTQHCPVADAINDSLMTFEVCAYDPTSVHLARLKGIVQHIAEKMEVEPHDYQPA